MLQLNRTRTRRINPTVVGAISLIYAATEREHHPGAERLMVKPTVNKAHIYLSKSMID